MKCTSCGWPLSPARTTTNCPRCGRPIGSGQKATSTPAQQQQVFVKNAGVVQAGAATSPPKNQWRQAAQHSAYNRPPVQTPQQLSQAGQLWLQGSVSQPGFFSAGTPSHLQAKSPRKSRKMKLGFTVAWLCVVIGGLILIFVYFLAIGLPGGSSNNTTNSTSHGSTLTTAPTSTVAPSPAATATVYPGQQYIDHAQMASAIDTATKQPAQLATTFKTNQKMYVIFQVHPPGHGGAVCLLWYLNGKQVTQFSFAASTYSKLSYAYAIYGEAGAGYVEIYWASTTQCKDQLLAQHIDFTVTT
jgi:hypothetical protein